VSSVFVSYRREDSAPYAGRICDRLEAAFGAEHVFMDVDDIAPGADFAETIEKRIGACQTLIAVIGPRWLETLRVRGGDQDFVENEIAAALRRGVTVIPALVSGAVMPSERDLPGKLAGLARRQALIIRDDRFDQDAADLVSGIRGRERTERSTRRFVWLLVAAGVLIAVMGAVVFLARSRDRASLNGTWIARMERPGLRPYNIRLRFEISGRTLTGQVEYPTGSGAIDGGMVGDGRLSFFTKHVPQFETEPATIRFSGEVRGAEVHLTAVTPDGAVAKGTARKVD
jgi:hypothetical protein